MRQKKGFTLIELLVVISIIAILLAILMPSLKIAKDIAKRITCSSNLRSLTSAALLYAEDNDGLTPSSTNRWQNDNGIWKGGWCGRTIDGNFEPYSEEVQIYGNGTDEYTGLHKGQLWKYIETTKAWRCPADSNKDMLRSYGMSANWWGQYTHDDGSVLDSAARLVARKSNEIRQPSERFMFVDSRGYMRDAFFAIYYNKKSWHNIPNFSHSGGSVNGFSDGHVEPYKLGSETIEDGMIGLQDVTNGYGMPGGEPETADGIKDLQYYQRCTWGELGPVWFE